MTLEPLLWLHCSISGRCLLEYIIGTQSPTQPPFRGGKRRRERAFCTPAEGSGDLLNRPRLCLRSPSVHDASFLLNLFIDLR